jgi:hypothetical protein
MNEPEGEVFGTPRTKIQVSTPDKAVVEGTQSHDLQSGPIENRNPIDVVLNEEELDI